MTYDNIMFKHLIEIIIRKITIVYAYIVIVYYYMLEKKVIYLKNYLYCELKIKFEKSFSDTGGGS